MEAIPHRFHWFKVYAIGIFDTYSGYLHGRSPVPAGTLKRHKTVYPEKRGRGGV